MANPNHQVEVLRVFSYSNVTNEDAICGRLLKNFRIELRFPRAVVAMKKYETCRIVKGYMDTAMPKRSKGQVLRSSRISPPEYEEGGWVGLALLGFALRVLAWLCLAWLGLAWVGLGWIALLCFAWLGLARVGLGWVGWLGLLGGWVGVGWVCFGVSVKPT